MKNIEYMGGQWSYVLVSVKRCAPEPMLCKDLVKSIVIGLILKANVRNSFTGGGSISFMNKRNRTEK